MGWNEFYRRRDALDAAVAQGALLPSDSFANAGELLLALQHRWAQRLASRIELAQLEIDDTVDAIGEAWRATAADNADLRGLLDRHAGHPALREVILAEQRMLATAAGLTEPGDGERDTAAIGAAFLALQSTRPTERRGPVERLLRRLVPSA